MLRDCRTEYYAIQYLTVLALIIFEYCSRINLLWTMDKTMSIISSSYGVRLLELHPAIVLLHRHSRHNQGFPTDTPYKSILWTDQEIITE